MTKRFIDEIVVHDNTLATDIAKSLADMKRSTDNWIFDIEIYETKTHVETRTGRVTTYEEPVTVLKVFIIENN